MTHIANSVGKNGMNLPVDVNYVQRLLNQKLSGTTHLRSPLIVDGDCGSNTQNAIRDFQQFILKFAHPDSLIQPGKTTITKLMAGIPAAELTKLWNEAVKAENKNLVTSGGRIALAQQQQKALPAELTPNPGFIDTPVSVGSYSFPLPVVPGQSYKEGGRRFGALRNKGQRKHAGCDLIVPPGTPICAIADGVVSAGPYYFYEGTYALEVKHGAMLVRYGEILPSSVNNLELTFLPEIKKGAAVKKGQLIAYVGKMNKDSMLHFECYGNSALVSGLTDRSKAGGAFQRRSDLMNPTNLLDSAKNSLPQHPGYLDAVSVKKAIKIGHGSKK
jgi:murein DD-endopeptidase MepM/ murein hydrolase activator NlpD